MTQRAWFISAVLFAAICMVAILLPMLITSLF